jgi:hypothetical protein
MFPYLFQYSEKDLMKKFRNIIETNHMIQGKKKIPDLNLIKEFTKKIDVLSDLDQSRERGNDNSSINYSDFKEFGSTSMSIVMQNHEESIIASILRPFESGITLFNSFQQMMLFKKNDDEFYNYKMKIYDVI